MRHLIFVIGGGSGEWFTQATGAVHGGAELYSNVKPFNWYHLESWVTARGEKGSIEVKILKSIYVFLSGEYTPEIGLGTEVASLLFICETH